MRDGFVFYRSFREAIRELPDEEQLKAYDAIMDYALDDIEPSGVGIATAIWKIAKPQIDANNRRYENGKKGGRPKKQEEPNNNQNKPNYNLEETKNNLDITKAKPKEKEKDKEKDKDKDIKENKKRKPSVSESRIGKMKYADEVYMKEEEYNDLVQKYKKDGAEWMIQKLDSYKKSSGKTYIDDRAAIRCWVEKEYLKIQPKSNNPWKNEVDQEALYKQMIGVV